MRVKGQEGESHLFCHPSDSSLIDSHFLSTSFVLATISLIDTAVLSFSFDSTLTTDSRSLTLTLSSVTSFIALTQLRCNTTPLVS